MESDTSEQDMEDTIIDYEIENHCRMVFKDNRLGMNDDK